jgi:hypothetical protein
MHHEVFRLILEGLHRAPVHNPGRILDIGTGTGIWAIEMADKYPEAEVIGMDLRYRAFSSPSCLPGRVANRIITNFLARSNPNGKCPSTRIPGMSRSPGLFCWLTRSVITGSRQTGTWFFLDRFSKVATLTSGALCSTFDVDDAELPWVYQPVCTLS